MSQVYFFIKFIYFLKGIPIMKSKNIANNSLINTIDSGSIVEVFKRYGVIVELKSGEGHRGILTVIYI